MKPRITRAIDDARRTLGIETMERVVFKMVSFWGVAAGLLLMVDRHDAWFTWNTKVMLPGGAFLIVSAGLLAYKYLTLKPDPPRLSSLYDPAQMLLAKAQQVQLNDEKSRLDAALAELNREMAGLDPRYTPQRQRFDTLNSRRHEIVQRLIDLRSRPTRHFGYTPK